MSVIRRSNTGHPSRKVLIITSATSYQQQSNRIQSEIFNFEHNIFLQLSHIISVVL